MAEQIPYIPPPVFHFSVIFEIPGIDAGENETFFQSVRGLEANVVTESIKEGGWNFYEHVVPVRTNYSDLTLKRGLLRNSAIIEWCMRALDMDIVPGNVTINLLGEDHDPLASWFLVHAWPKKWSVGEMNSEQNAILLETLDLHYNYFLLDYPANRPTGRKSTFRPRR